MPNLENIDSPVTLISFGRSGSSLLSNIFERHPAFRFVGETVNLIFGIWNAVEVSASGMPALFENERWVPEDERAGRAVRQGFLACLPDDRSRWFQKPIGMPTILVSNYDEGCWPDAAEHYWRVMKHSFPRARYFTILRNPSDVVLSAKSYWGYDERTLWELSARLAYFLAHPSSPVVYAITFDDLVRDSEATVRKLFNYLDVPFDEKVLEALGTVHVPASGREDIKTLSTTRREQWKELDSANIDLNHIQAFAKLYAKFDHRLEWPAHFATATASPPVPARSVLPEPDTSTPEEQIERLEKTIDTLNHNLEKTHLSFEKKLRDREMEFHAIWTEQRTWIATLEDGKAWLEQALKSAENLANEREAALITQRKWIESLEEGKAWLEQAWKSAERAADEREAELQRLKNPSLSPKD